MNTFLEFKTCTRCIYDEAMGGISFDNQGICNYCRQVDELMEVYGTGSAKGRAKLELPKSR